jgi:putative glutamine amidotransferase
MQSMNVAAGGTLYQDIPMQIYNFQTVEQVLKSNPEVQHRNYHNNYGIDSELIWNSFHSINYEKKGLFDRLRGGSTSPMYIWSSHHQCVKDLGKGYVPIAWSIDGKIIEAMAHTTYYNVLGVQFHPEPQAIFDSTLKLNQLPFEKAPKSYGEMYSGELGLNFHRCFWKEMGIRFSRFQ